MENAVFINPGDSGYVEWAARWHPIPKIRHCAQKALARVAERKEFDDRIRRIVREELDRKTGD